MCLLLKTGVGEGFKLYGNVNLDRLFAFYFTELVSELHANEAEIVSALESYIVAMATSFVKKKNNHSKFRSDCVLFGTTFQDAN